MSWLFLAGLPGRIAIAPTQASGSRSSQIPRIADLEQAANLQARAELLPQTAAIIKDSDCKPADAAGHCSVTQPRINDLSRFFLNSLLNIATTLDLSLIHI